MTAAPLLLIWDDDGAAHLAGALTLDGFAVSHARTAEQARVLARTGSPFSRSSECWARLAEGSS